MSLGDWKWSDIIRIIVVPSSKSGFLPYSIGSGFSVYNIRCSNGKQLINESSITVSQYFIFLTFAVDWQNYPSMRYCSAL